MSVATATAAYEAARVAYVRAAEDLRAEIAREVADLAGGLPPDVLRIAERVAAEFGVELVNLLSPSRRREHAEPRHAVLALCAEALPISTVELAAYFRRDHGAVTHSRQAFARLVESDPGYRDRVARIRAALSASVPPAPGS